MMAVSSSRPGPRPGSGKVCSSYLGSGTQGTGTAGPIFRAARARSRSWPGAGEWADCGLYALAGAGARDSASRAGYIDKVPRLWAVGVRCDSMINLQAIADRTGVTREAVRLWVA